jgi:hypothetical protein
MLQTFIGNLQRAGVPKDQWYDAVAAYLPVMSGQDRTQLQQVKVQLDASKAAEKAYKDVVDLNEKGRHNLATEGQAGQRIAQGDTRLGIQQEVADTGKQRVVAYSKKLADDIETGSKPIDKQTVDFYAKQSLGGDNSWQVGLARGKVGQKLIAAVKDRIPQMAAETGQSAMDAVANKADMGALTKTLADRTKYSTAVEQLQGTLTKQAGLVEDLLSKGASEAGSPVLNKWLQAGRKATGDPDVRALNAAIVGLGREHQRVLTSPLSNAQLHASASATADELINTADTPEAIRAIIKVMQTEAANGRQQATETVDEVRNKIKELGKGNGVSPPGAKPASEWTNAKGWKLHMDAQGNRAYVSPDGKQFEEAK